MSLADGTTLCYFIMIQSQSSPCRNNNLKLSPGSHIRFLTMCGGWACASFDLACNNPPLSTLRFTGRDFIPTPCGPCDKCYVLDTSRKKNTNNCYVPHILSPLDAQLCTLASTQKKKEDE